MTHTVLVRPVVFGAIMSGQRFLVVRRNSDHKIGDSVRLEEFDQTAGQTTGAALLREIAYVLNDDPGIAPGYRVIGLGGAP